MLVDVTSRADPHNLTHSASMDWGANPSSMFRPDMAELERSIGDIEQSNAEFSRIQRRKKQSLVQELEEFQTDSKYLTKQMISVLTKQNKKKHMLNTEYVSNLQNLDKVFTVIRQEGGEILQEQIIETFVRSNDKSADRGRRLMEVEAEICRYQALLDKNKSTILTGVKNTMEQQKQQTKQIKTKQREEERITSSMTMYTLFYLQHESELQQARTRNYQCKKVCPNRVSVLVGQGDFEEYQRTSARIERFSSKPSC